MFEKLFKKDTDDKQIERLTFEQLTLQEKGLILVYRECNHNILKACSQILTIFAEKQGHKQLTLAKIFFAISIVGGSFMCINSLLAYGTILSREPFLTFNLKELYGFIAYCFSITIIIYYYKELVWESKIRRTDIKLKFSEEIQKMLPEQTLMTTITNNKDNTIQLVIMTEDERNKMTEKEIREIINQSNENERKD